MLDPAELINAAFLARHPEVRRKFFSRPRVIVMAFKPKYAKAIYDGKKNWEFRKVPPPLFREIYIYESAPVSAVTGTVVFSESVTGVPIVVYDIAKHSKQDDKFRPGVTLEELERYTGKKLLTGLHVYRAKRLDVRPDFDAKPPQNWGRFLVSRASPIAAKEGKVSND